MTLKIPRSYKIKEDWELSHIKVSQGDETDKCNVKSLVGSWNGRMTLVEKFDEILIKFIYYNSIISLLISWFW